MKYSVAVVALAAAVTAQSLNDIPSCALPCIDDARTSQTNCAADDYKCICDNIDQLTGTATPCVLKGCGADTALNKVLPAVQTFCSAVEAGGSGGASSSEGSEGSSSAPASTSEATSAESTAEPTSSSESAPASSSSVGTITSSVVQTVTSQTLIATTTAAPSSSAGAGSNGTATASSTSPIPTAGAAVAGSMGGLVMLALGAFAL
ncbi:hypothetical protein F4808DRAFT_461791 [Astrocystis sublimbata]|nr:hypothetical protein F4808DRAFT_461791 [Astrocystis sublimbata]